MYTPNAKSSLFFFIKKIQYNNKKQSICTLQIYRSLGDIIHLYDIYPDLANHNKHHNSASYTQSSNRPGFNNLLNSHVTSSSHSAMSNFPSNHPYQISSSASSHYTTNRPHAQPALMSYKPLTTRPGSGNGFSNGPGPWDHDTNHLGGAGSHTGITNHLDNFFDVPPEQPGQRPLGLGNAVHSLLANDGPYAVGNILDLNNGEIGDDYGSVTTKYSDNSYRPVPGIKTRISVSVYITYLIRSFS